MLSLTSSGKDKVWTTKLFFFWLTQPLCQGKSIIIKRALSVYSGVLPLPSQIDLLELIFCECLFFKATETFVPSICFHVSPVTGSSHSRI